MPHSLRVRALACAALTFAMPVAALGTAAAAEHPLSLRPMTTEAVIFSFDGSDGLIPSAGLIQDKQGNLYSTTTYNGGQYGYGNVFELKRGGSTWKELDLYDFKGGTDGAYPLDSLVFDKLGNLYGTTQVGGQAICTSGSPPLGCGTVFELSPGCKGWTETQLYSFAPGKSLGTVPVGGLVFDKAGNLYGTTWAPGVENGPLNVRRHAHSQTFWGCDEPGCGGTVFELSPSASGWTETDLYAFTGGADGSSSTANLVWDAAGKNLYGTTNYGGTTTCTGAYGCGTVFELEHRKSGWKEKVLLRLPGGTGGATPAGSLLWDTKGNLYTTASYGGDGNHGLVFELSPSAKTWAQNVLYTFTGGADGALPEAALVADAQGNLYSTTEAGGDPTYHSGVVFELSLSGSTWAQTVLHTFTHLGGDGQGPVSPVMFGPNGLLYGTAQAGGADNGGVVYALQP